MVWEPVGCSPGGSWPLDRPPFPRALRIAQGGCWPGTGSIFAQRGARRGGCTGSPVQGGRTRHQKHKERRGRDQRDEPETEARETQRQTDRQTDRSRQWRVGGGSVRARLGDMSRSHLLGLLSPPSSEGQPRPDQHPTSGAGPLPCASHPLPSCRCSGLCQVGVSAAVPGKAPRRRTHGGGAGAREPSRV